MKYYGLRAITDDDIDEFSEYLKTAKNERIPLTYNLLRREISALMGGIKKYKQRASKEKDNHDYLEKIEEYEERISVLIPHYEIAKKTI